MRWIIDGEKIRTKQQKLEPSWRLPIWPRQKYQEEKEEIFPKFLGSPPKLEDNHGKLG